MAYILPMFAEFWFNVVTESGFIRTELHFLKSIFSGEIFRGSHPQNQTLTLKSLSNCCSLKFGLFHNLYKIHTNGWYRMSCMWAWQCCPLLSPSDIFSFAFFESVPSLISVSNVVNVLSVRENDVSKGTWETSTNVCVNYVTVQ